MMVGTAEDNGVRDETSRVTQFVLCLLGAE